MKDYSEFTLEDFVQDPGFRMWALSKQSSGCDLFWDNWIYENPEKLLLVLQAKELVKASAVNELPDWPEDLSDQIEKVFLRTTRKPVRINTGITPFFKIAAVFIFITGLGWWFLSSRQNDLSKDADRNLVAHKNNLNLSSRVTVLSDGSKVTCKGDSKIWVDKQFGKDQRTVYLRGEAFFEVSRDVKKPFLVVTDDLTTKVLGTSFLVKANTGDANISVSVNTGKVSVSNKDRSGSKNLLANSVNLIPNQQATYDRNQRRLIKTLVQDPVIISHSANQFDFHQLPVHEVFVVLERAYGIPIVFDRKKVRHCTIIASMKSGSLYEKLDLVCEMIQASYQIINGEIVINARGCSQM